jgi:DNA-binding transcriptional MocR family regulator
MHKRDLMVRGIENFGLGLTVAEAKAGLHMTVQLTRQVDAESYERLASSIRTQANKAQLAIAFTSDFSMASGVPDSLFLRYGGLSDDLIHEGLRTLKLVLRMALLE